MVDSDVVGCCWIELPKGKYRVREERSMGETDSKYPGKVGLDHMAPSALSVVMSQTINFMQYSYYPAFTNGVYDLCP